MAFVKTYKEFMNEALSFSELYRPKNMWMRLYNSEHWDSLLDNLYVLSDTAYGPLGGHPDFSNEDRIWKMDWRPMIKDVDVSEQIVIIGHETPIGFKIRAIGHDGLKAGRRELLKSLSILLTHAGYWMETSSYMAERLYEMGIPYLEQRGHVLDIYSDIEWLGDRGWYYRERRGTMSKQVIFGRPVNKIEKG